MASITFVFVSAIHATPRSSRFKCVIGSVTNVGMTLRVRARIGKPPGEPLRLVSRAARLHALGSMRFLRFIGILVASAAAARANPVLDTNAPLSRAAAVETALNQNTAIRKGQADLRAAYGIEVQLRSILVPKLTAGGDFNANDPSLVGQFPSPPNFPISSFIQFPTKNWAADVKVQESIYEGGRITSALRSAKLTRAGS